MDGSGFLFTHWLLPGCGFLLLVASVRHYSPRTPLPAESWLLGIPYTHGLLLGAAAATTDPASVAHMLGRFAIPRHLTLVLEGESIFNDAITLVLFGALALLVLNAAALSPLEVAVSVARSMLLAVPIGLLLGWLAGLTVRGWREQNRFPGLTLTLVLPVAGFLLSERLLHASGIIAVLCAALAFGHTRRGVGPADGRELYQEFWEYLGSLGASALYFALGAAVVFQNFPLGWVVRRRQHSLPRRARPSARRSGANLGHQRLAPHPQQRVSESLY
jgi:CPA1 family monovalent cation:H+ antiporter